MEKVLIDIVFFVAGAIVGFFIGLYFHRKQRRERKQERDQQTKTLIEYFEQRLPNPVVQEGRKIAQGVVREYEAKKNRPVGDSARLALYSNALFFLATSSTSLGPLAGVVTPEIREEASRSLVRAIFAEPPSLDSYVGFSPPPPITGTGSVSTKKATMSGTGVVHNPNWIVRLPRAIGTFFRTLFGRR